MLGSFLVLSLLLPGPFPRFKEVLWNLIFFSLLHSFYPSLDLLRLTSLYAQSAEFDLLFRVSPDRKMSGYRLFLVCFFSPSPVPCPYRLNCSKGDDTKIDAFGVELSSHVKWLIPVSLLVVGILGIIYVATKIFMRYE